MNRCLRYVFSICASLILAAGPALADKGCQPSPQGPVCISSVNFVNFAEFAYQNQQMSEWCWAACISMVFRFHGHPVSQPRIVAEAYGGVANLPAGSGITIAQALNRHWTDDLGRPFTAHLAGVYDVSAGINTLDNAQITRELTANRPMIVANTHHAMVMTAIQYYDRSPEPVVASVGVFDPWPGNGAHALSPPELVPAHLGGQLTFLATVNVTEG